jgi:hydroxymethylbilane synthase
MVADAPSPDRPLRIGTRGSPLALAQAYETRARLMSAHSLPEEAFAIVVIRTTGDRVQDRPLAELGGKGLFTKEIEEALLAGMIDIAVHSMKDMPTRQPDGLAITALLPREDVRDAFVTLGEMTLATLPAGAVIGTSSLRRRAQLAHRRPDLAVVEFRGNVQTRMRKLAEGVADATFLAMAGLKRLGLVEIARRPIETADMLPAVAQGAIGIEQRRGDDAVSALLAAIHDGETGDRIAAERAFLAGLDGSCQTPIAGLAEISGGDIHLRGEILRPDGSEAVGGERVGPIADAARLGADLAAELRARAGPGFFAA